MPPLTQSRSGRALLFALTAALVLLVAANYSARRHTVVPDDGVTWVDDGGKVEARRIQEGSGAARAGLRRGDVLLQINGAAIGSARNVQPLLDAAGAWSRVGYRLSREGQVFDASLILGASSAAGLPYYFQLVLGSAFLLIGLLVVMRGRAGAGERPMALHFFAYCVLSFVVHAFSYTGELDAFDRLIYWADVWALLFVAPIFLHFCLRFPGGGAGRTHPAALLAAYLPSVALAALYHAAAADLWRTDMPIVELRFLLDRISVGQFGFYLVIGAAVLNFRARRAQPQGPEAADEHSLTILRQQRKWLANGTLWGALPFVFFYVIPFVAGQAPTPPRNLAVLSLGLIPLTFAYAIVRFRLMDVDLIFRRSAAYSLATLALLGIFYGITFLASGWVQPGIRGFAPAIWLASVVAAGLLYQPLRRRIQRYFDRRVFRERYDYRRTLVDFASDLSTETDLDLMLGALGGRLVASLDIERLAIFVRREGDQADAPFELAHAAGIPAEAIARLDSGSREALDFLVPAATAAEPLFVENPEQHSGGKRLLGLNHYVPCRVRGRTIAFLGLGRTNAGDYLSSEDLSLLKAVSGYFAIALENARLYRSLERKALEYERLKEYNENIVESLHVGILAVDLDDRVESWNTELELVFGISRRDAVGRRLAELLPAPLVNQIENAREEAGVHNIYKFRLRAEDFPREFRPQNGNGASGSHGGERIVNVVVTPLVAKNFERIGRLIILDDVTDRVELEEQVVQADKLSSVGLLAAGVAHEVNTPLAVISSYAQMLAKRVAEDPQQAKMLDKITTQTFRASEIVNSLLSFSRAAGGGKAEVDVVRAVEDTLALLEHQLQQARVRIETSWENGAIPVTGNHNRLQQVFLNLFLNARDAMPRGGVLRVRAEVPDGEEPPLARIEISDSGVGIGEENLKRIFDPFFTTKGPKRGTGLGLAVAYGIVQEHSGRIRVDSAPGEGTTFVIELPLAEKRIHA